MASRPGSATEIKSTPPTARFVVVAPTGSRVAVAAMDRAGLPAAAVSVQPDPYLALAEIAVVARAQVSRSAWGLARIDRAGLLLTDEDGLGADGRAALIAAIDRFVPELEVLVHEDGQLRTARGMAPDRVEDDDVHDAAPAMTRSMTHGMASEMTATPPTARGRDAALSSTTPPVAESTRESTPESTPEPTPGPTPGPTPEPTPGPTRVPTRAPTLAPASARASAPALRLTESMPFDDERDDVVHDSSVMDVTSEPERTDEPPIDSSPDDDEPHALDDPHEPLIARVTSEELAMLLDPPPEAHGSDDR